MNIRLFFETIRSKLVSGNDLNENDTIILVIGTAGSGKTSFINTVAQKCNLSVDHSLSGGTKKVAPVRCSTPTVDTTRVVLVDTPPYPDEQGEDEILGWVKDMKKAKVKGIVFLHPITAPRGRPEDYCRKIKALGGPDIAKAPVILATTFWRMEAHKPKYEARLQDITKGWVHSGMSGPAPVVYDETPDSAWHIVHAILKACGTDFDISGFT